MPDFEIRPITYFTTPGPHNTDAVIRLAIERAAEGDISAVVVATSSGATGLSVMNASQGEITVPIVPVVLNAGSSHAGSDEWQNNRKKFEAQNIRYIQGIQAFSGVERAITERNR